MIDLQGRHFLEHVDIYWWAGDDRRFSVILEDGPNRVTAYDQTYYDCSKLPVSMNGDSHPKGCAGAVWSNGEASKTYCDGKNSGVELPFLTYPWWAHCCVWDGAKCVPKDDAPAAEAARGRFNSSSDRE